MHNPDLSTDWISTQIQNLRPIPGKIQTQNSQGINLPLLYISNFIYKCSDKCESACVHVGVQVSVSVCLCERERESLVFYEQE